MTKKTKKKTTKAKKAKEKAWTFMVFMVADELLQPYVDRDLLEMKRVGSSRDFNLVVQLQRKADASIERFEFGHRLPKTGERPHPPPVALRTVDRLADADVGGVKTLREFLDFSVDRYPARHYALVLWGHAMGIGFGRLDPKHEKDLLQLPDLADALKGFRRDKRAATGGGDTALEILGFCACATSKAEFAHELRECVQFLVSSEVGISVLTTWPFDLILEKLLTSPNMDARGLAEAIVRSFREMYEPPTIALTALNLPESGWIGPHVRAIAAAIVAGMRAPDVNESTLIKACVLKAFRRARRDNPYEDEPVVDFLVLSETLIEELGPMQAATSLAAPIVNAARPVVDSGKGPFVASHMCLGPRMGKLNGMTILAPVLTGKTIGSSAWKAFYKTRKRERLPKLWQETEWPAVIEGLFTFGEQHPELAES